MAVYIDPSPKWPPFRWDPESLIYPLSQLRYEHGRLLGRMEILGLTTPAGAHTPLNIEQINKWYSDYYHDRTNSHSASIHFETASGKSLPRELQAFFRWIHLDNTVDPILKAAIAESWFITLKPFPSEQATRNIGFRIAGRLLDQTGLDPQFFYSKTAFPDFIGNAYITDRKTSTDPDITMLLRSFLDGLMKSILAAGKDLDDSVRMARFWEKYRELRFNDRQIKMLAAVLKGSSLNLTSSSWARTVDCSSDTAVRDINELVEKGILIKQRAGGRSTNYIFAPL